MLAGKTCLVYLGLIVLQVNGLRVVRSPDKMEVDVPNRRPGSGEYQEGINNEAEYWKGKEEDKEKEGHDQLDEDREKNEETYHHEKEHLQGNQDAYNKEMNETYQSDKETIISHHHDNQNHINEHENDAHTQTMPDVDMESETADRYEDKGNEYKEEGEDAIYNYKPGENNPTITYTRD